VYTSRRPGSAGFQEKGNNRGKTVRLPEKKKMHEVTTSETENGRQNQGNGGM